MQGELVSYPAKKAAKVQGYELFCGFGLEPNSLGGVVSNHGVALWPILAYNN
jgi:hypothetical protein